MLIVVSICETNRFFYLYLRMTITVTSESVYSIRYMCSSNNAIWLCLYSCVKNIVRISQENIQKRLLSKNIELKSSNPTQVLRWIKPTLNKKVSRIKEQQNSNRFQNYSIFVVVFKGSCIVNRSQFIRLANGLKLLLSESVYKIMIKCYLYLYKISFSIWLIYLNPK